MKFAIVEGQRREAEPRLSGECPSCGSSMTPKCGPVRIRHWAHASTHSCDPWWENETPWHRAWKNQFPQDCQEVTQRADDGERHVADVKTSSGAVLEFQHSALRLDERVSREAFYPQLVWVVHGSARDKAKFASALRQTTLPSVFSAASDACALLRKWSCSRVPVYFDFGDGGETGEHTLWRLHSGNGLTYLLAVTKVEFVGAHRRGDDFEETLRSLMQQAVDLFRRQSSRPQPLNGFDAYLAMKARDRPRL